MKKALQKSGTGVSKAVENHGNVVEGVMGKMTDAISKVPMIGGIAAAGIVATGIAAKILEVASKKTLAIMEKKTGHMVDLDKKHDFAKQAGIDPREFQMILGGMSYNSSEENTMDLLQKYIKHARTNKRNVFDRVDNETKEKVSVGQVFMHDLERIGKIEDKEEQINEMERVFGTRVFSELEDAITAVNELKAKELRGEVFQKTYNLTEAQAAGSSDMLAKADQYSSKRGEMEFAARVEKGLISTAGNSVQQGLELERAKHKNEILELLRVTDKASEGALKWLNAKDAMEQKFLDGLQGVTNTLYDIIEGGKKFASWFTFKKHQEETVKNDPPEDNSGTVGF